MELAGSAYWRKPDPRHVQECIEQLGSVGGKAPSTPGTTDTLKNLADAEDSLSEVESKSFQRLAGKMLYHSLDDPTIQFDKAMLISGVCQPTVGAMARLMTAWRSHGGSSLKNPRKRWQCWWLRTTPQMRRHACACRAATYLEHWVVRDSLRSSSNGCFVIGRVRVLRSKHGMRCCSVGDKR